MHLNQRGSLPVIILIILVALLTASVAYNIYLTGENTKFSEKLAPAPVKIADDTRISEASAAPANQWKTYTSPLGFSIQYPATDLPLVAETPLSISKLYPKPPVNINIQGANMIVDITVATAPAELSIKNALGEGPKNNYDFSLLTNENDNFEKFKIDGVDAIRVDAVSASGQSPLTDVIFFKNENIYEISYSPINAGNEEIFNQMLTTFKFQN